MFVYGISCKTKLRVHTERKEKCPKIEYQCHLDHVLKFTAIPLILV
jgi:hypothetical protein